jgi:TPR repeat protein
VALAESEALWKRADANKQAFALFRAAAQMGHDGAQVNVGYCYDVGKGVRRNLSRAMLWYKRASRRGDSGAAHNIGTIYRDKGAFGLARRWFLLAIKRGNAGSAVELAKLYLARGRPSIARRHLTFAVSQFDSMSEYEFEEAERLLDSLNQGSVSS